jgi:ribosome-associated heat shock protein Hsp15
MRLDKFLWSVRKYKTRNKSAEGIKKERVMVNDEAAKASREVHQGDRISYSREGITYKLLVKELPPSRVGAKLLDEYIEDQTDALELEKREFISMMRTFNRQRGTGRPTKKERRDYDDFRDKQIP